MTVIVPPSGAELVWLTLLVTSSDVSRVNRAVRGDRAQYCFTEGPRDADLLRLSAEDQAVPGVEVSDRALPRWLAATSGTGPGIRRPSRLDNYLENVQHRIWNTPNIDQTRADAMGSAASGIQPTLRPTPSQTCELSTGCPRVCVMACTTRLHQFQPAEQRGDLIVAAQRHVFGHVDRAA